MHSDLIIHLAAARAQRTRILSRGDARDQQPADRARGRARRARGRAADAADGRPSLAFVAGESGVGKTRLVAELARRTRDGGARVASATASSSARASCPTRRSSRVLRPLARDGDPVLDELPAAARAELADAAPRARRDAGRGEPTRATRRRRRRRGCSRRC